MKQPAIKLALLFAALWIIVKLVFYSLGLFGNDIVIPGLINNFFLLTAISLGLYYEKRKEGFGKGTALSDIKKAVKTGFLYVVIVCGFIFFYYNNLNPTFIENRVEKRMDNVYSAMERPAFVDSLRQQNQGYKAMNKAEIYEEIKKDTKSTLSASSMLTFSLLGLIILAFSYAVFITLIYRKIMFRDYYKGE